MSAQSSINIYMQKLSVIIITCNEAHNIQRCLESVRFADEIIVIDSGSVDDTVTICQQYTSQVFSTDWPGYGPQKNRALAKATGDWVLSLDADEVLSDALQRDIKQHIQNTHYHAFTLPFTTIWWGKTIQHGDVGTDHKCRLFRREHGKFSDDQVHERLIINGAIGALQQPLFHYSYHSLEDLLTRINHYSTDAATMKYQRGKRCRLSVAIFKSAWAFVRSYFLRRGFLDGAIGLMVAISSAESTYYRYAKLYLLSEQQA